MRIAILGCGSIGRRHLRNLLAMGGHELFPFDSNAEARVHLKKVIGIDALSDLESVWSAEPQAVVIAATPTAHRELACAAVSHGAHLFIEKPVAACLEGLDELQNLVVRKDLITMAGCNMRFHPGPARIKAALESGEMGAVFAARIQTGSYLPDWRPSTDYRKSYSALRQQGGGAVLDCIHELDLALWYFGAASVKAAASMPADTLGIAVEGLAEILLHHARGVLSSVGLNFMQRDYRRCCQIVGENGTLYWDFEDPWVEVRSGAGIEKRYQLDPTWEVNQMYVDEMAHFLRAVERHEPTLCPLEQGIAALKVALRARELALHEAGNHA